jgi:hypothetical protein
LLVKLHSRTSSFGNWQYLAMMLAVAVHSLLFWPLQVKEAQNGMGNH